MSSPVIETALSPNFRRGRQGYSIIAIVNHITDGLMPGTLNWMLSTESKVSAHYLVTKTGRIIQMVADEDTAYAVGNVNQPTWTLYDGSNPNNYTLSIEHEALSGEGLTEAQYQSTMALHWQLISKWQIPIDRNHIIGHYVLDSINRLNDPGANFPWEQLMADLQNKLLEQAGLASVAVEVDGKRVNGVIVNNRSYVPVKDIFAILGREVTWDEYTRIVHVLAAQPDAKIAAGNKTFDGYIRNNTTYAAIRPIAEALGHKVSWNQNSKTVTIE